MVIYRDVLCGILHKDEKPTTFNHGHFTKEYFLAIQNRSEIRTDVVPFLSVRQHSSCTCHVQSAVTIPILEFEWQQSKFPSKLNCDEKIFRGFSTLYPWHETSNIYAFAPMRPWLSTFQPMRIEISPTSWLVRSLQNIMIINYGISKNHANCNTNNSVITAVRPFKRRFADIFKCIFLYENYSILIQTWLKFAPKGSIDNTSPDIQSVSISTSYFFKFHMFQTNYWLDTSNHLWPNSAQIRNAILIANI